MGIADGGDALLDAELLAIGLAVAVLSSAIPYSVELEALRRLPESTFGVLMSLEPAVAATGRIRGARPGPGGARGRGDRTGAGGERRARYGAAALPGGAAQGEARRRREAPGSYPRHSVTGSRG